MNPTTDEQVNLVADEQMKTKFKLSSIFFLESLYLLLIFSLPFVQPLNFKVSGLTVQPTDAIFLLLFVVFAYTVIREKLTLRFTGFYYLLGFYVLALALSAAFSITPKTSFLKLATEFYLFFLLIITFTIVRSIDFFKKVALVWLAATAIVSLIGAVSVLFFYVAPTNVLLNYTLYNYGSLVPGNYPRLQSTFYYAAMLCHYLSIGLMLLFIARKNEWISQTIFWIILLPLLITLLFTVTPGLGGIALSIGLWYSLIYKAKSQPAKASLILSGGILIAVLFLLISLVSPAKSDTSPYFVDVPVIEKRIDPSPRLLTWQSATESFIAHPFFGKGLGTEAIQVYYKAPSGDLQYLTDAHQMWLNVAAQSGIFGLAAIILITVYFFRKGFPVEPFGSTDQTIYTGLLIAFISAFIYQGLTGSYEESRSLWVMMGLLLSAEKLTERAE